MKCKATANVGTDKGRKINILQDITIVPKQKYSVKDNHHVNSSDIKTNVSFFYNQSSKL